jgi:hypothetical protein
VPAPSARWRASTAPFCCEGLRGPSNVCGTGQAIEARGFGVISTCVLQYRRVCCRATSRYPQLGGKGQPGVCRPAGTRVCVLSRGFPGLHKFARIACSGDEQGCYDAAWCTSQNVKHQPQVYMRALRAPTCANICPVRPLACPCPVRSIQHIHILFTSHHSSDVNSNTISQVGCTLPQTCGSRCRVRSAASQAPMRTHTPCSSTPGRRRPCAVFHLDAELNAQPPRPNCDLYDQARGFWRQVGVPPAKLEYPVRPSPGCDRGMTVAPAATAASAPSTSSLHDRRDNVNRLIRVCLSPLWPHPLRIHLIAHA